MESLIILGICSILALILVWMIFPLSDLIKVLGRGKLKAKVNVTAHYFSATAAKAVEKAGGKIKKLINE